MPKRLLTRGRIATWSLIPLSLILMGCMFSPDRLILFPTTEATGTVGATRRTIPFEGGQLEIWTGRSRRAVTGHPPDAYLLRFYGNADRADSNVGVEAAEWTGRPVEIWGANYPGYGTSTGPARLSRMGSAALAAFDALQTVAGHRPIIVFGTSIGTTVALHVAAHRPVAGVILQNPPPLRQIALRQFGWWNLWLIAGPLALRIPSSLDSVANARAVHAPGLFLLSERDEIVRPRYQRLVVDAYAGEKEIVPLPGAGHNDPLAPAVQAKVVAAVDRMAAGSGR